MQMFSLGDTLLFGRVPMGGGDLGIAALVLAAGAVSAAAALPAAVLADKTNGQRQQNKNYNHNNDACHIRYPPVFAFTIPRFAAGRKGHA